jgi:hypothetical protein
MRRQPASQPIFSRRLGAGSGRGSVHVKIFSPQPSTEHEGEWTCRYSVSRLGPTNRAAIGVDALQAFLVAYNHIATTLTENESTLSFNGNSVRLSFPRLLPYYSDEFSKHLDKVIHTETERFGRKLARRKRAATTSSKNRP